MSSEYVSNVTLEVNGQEIDDFKKVEVGEVELNKQVNLMNKTGTTGITPRRTVVVDYVIPEDAPEFDFTTVKNGTLTIGYQNGKRIQFFGVTTLKIGATSFDGDNEAVRSITLHATDEQEG